MNKLQILTSRGFKCYKVIQQNLVFYLKTSRFYYLEFISYHFFFEFEYQVFWDLKKKKKCLDNFDFLNILTVRIG